MDLLTWNICSISLSTKIAWPVQYFQPFLPFKKNLGHQHPLCYFLLWAILHIRFQVFSDAYHCCQPWSCWNAFTSKAQGCTFKFDSGDFNSKSRQSSCVTVWIMKTVRWDVRLRPHLSTRYIFLKTPVALIQRPGELAFVSWPIFIMKKQIIRSLPHSFFGNLAGCKLNTAFATHYNTSEALNQL